MRSSKNRSRSKSNNRQRSIGNIINRVFDSSGPESKVRGTPQQIIEKYLQLARDAQLSNDRVAEQNFLQHAEHYTRMLGEAQAELAREQASRPPQSANDRPQYSGNRDRDDQQPSGNYGDQPALYDPEEAAIVETPEMRARSENDQRREPRQNNNQNNNNQNNNRNDGQRNDGQRYEGQRDRNQPRNENHRQQRNDQNRNDQNRNDSNRGDQDRSDQNRSDASRQEQPRQEQPRQEQPRPEQTNVQTHEDRPRREPRPPRPPREDAEASGADIPLPAFVAEPLRVVDAAPVTEAAEKPKPRRRTAKAVVEAATNDSDSAPSE